MRRSNSTFQNSRGVNIVNTSREKGRESFLKEREGETDRARDSWEEGERQRQRDIQTRTQADRDRERQTYRDSQKQKDRD